MPTIQIRIDEKTKNKTKKVFNDLGIDISTGIKMYLKQVILRKGLPFLVLTKNDLTNKQENEILKAAFEGQKGKNVTKSMDLNQVKKFLG